MRKVTVLHMVILAIMIVLTSTTFAGEWVQVGNNWQYKNGDEFIKDTWKNIEDNNYHFDSNGNLSTGICEINGKFHAFKDDGKPYDQGSTIKICGNTYTIGVRGMITKLPDDFTLDSIKEYEESVANQESQKKESEQESSIKMASLKAKMATRETTTVNNNSPIGDIVPPEKDNSYSSNIAKYTIPESEIQKLYKAIDTSTSDDLAVKNLGNEFKQQVSLLTISLSHNNTANYASNAQGIDANNGEGIFDLAIKEYKKLIPELISYAKSKFNFGTTIQGKFETSLNSTIEENIKKFEKEINKEE